MSLSKTDTITPVLIAAVGQTIFAYTDIKILVAADLEVSKDGVVQTLTTDYSVTGVGDEAGGTVVFVTPMTGGEEIVLRRVPSLTQATVYPETGKFPAASHEQALDKLTMIAQYLSETDERTPKWPSSIDKTAVGATLPDPTTNAGKVLGFATTGIVPITVTSTDIAQPLTQKGGLMGFTTVPAEIAPSTDNHLLVYNSANANGFSQLSIGSTLKKLATTQGDILYHNGSNVVRFPLIGTNEMYGSDGTDVVAKQIPWSQGQCRLVYTDSTTVTLTPYNGDTLILKTGSNWGILSIPTAGPTLDVSSLSPTTLYYIYAYDVNDTGVIGLVASATAPSVEATHGFYVKDGDADFLLVGAMYTSAGPITRDSIVDRHVRSWFNDPGFVTQADYASGGQATSSATYVEVNTEIRCSAVVWKGETLQWTLDSYPTVDAINSDTYSALGIDSTTVATYGQIFQTADATAAFPAQQQYTWQAPATAIHVFSHLAKNPAADTVTFNSSSGVEASTQQVIGTGRKQL